MKRISPEALAYCKNFTFTFSKTYKSDNVYLENYSDYNFIIDVDGTVYQSKIANENSATVMVIGGINKFANGKAITIDVNYYLSEQQKITLYKIIKAISKYTDSATFDSDNEKLARNLEALYSNYCG